MITSDSELDTDVCVGTFRWSVNKRLPSLNSLGDIVGDVFVGDGWSGYLGTRFGPGAIAASHCDLSVIDGLSYALSCIYALDSIGCKPTDIVVMGATYKAEVRLLEETSYWEEIQAYHPVTVWFVGPELLHSTRSNVFKGTIYDFLHKKPCLVSESTVLVGFNPGFGTVPLVDSWVKDLEYILDSNLRCVFTQANDYSDLRGELVVLRSLFEAQFVLGPLKNPFHMAMTACEKDPYTSPWSCGNSYMYIVQGRRPAKVDFNKKLPVIRSLLENFMTTVETYDFKPEVLIKNEKVWELD